ncbi:ATP-dependent RecD-like DNA helicase [Novipirellula galeiformis]|uniref:ATP-dependent RecD-like DNA helicase n=1 Tax=Novipirellula galeiformis TaxID=2528004 RepID=A0A5C6CEF6_9BACT|nr:AAA family ATPase [Novipirellula galeiformis]TWU22482.1 ATP-dependent RecD-like DNA helicase [Novipirellula galeiformis]
MAKLEEIEGVFRKQYTRRGEWMAGVITAGEDDLPVNGDADDEELSVGHRYRFYGRYTEYRGEKQFKFQTFVPARAHDRDGVIEYLILAGRGNHLGKATAAKLWDAFGSDAVRIVRETPEELLRFSNGMTREQAATIGSILTAKKATEDATIELTNLLTGRGLPKTTARKAIKKWGNKAAEIVRKDPFSLMAFRGCGFKLCDALWIHLGHRPDRLKRQALCAWHSVASDNSGHTWIPIEHVIQSVRQNIGSAKARPIAAIKLAIRLGKMHPEHYGSLSSIKTVGTDGPIDPNGNRVWIAEGKKAAAESDLAEMVAAALAEAKPSTITEYEDRTITWEEAATAFQCARCGRELTAPMVHVWNGKPFGPTCIQTISDGTDVDVVPLVDYAAGLPLQVKTAIQSMPRGNVVVPSRSLWPNPATIDGIDDHQREKLTDALVSRVAILGGSPGTGKTYATAMLIRALLRSGKVGPDDIAIGAPTGKAAVRLTEALQAAGVNLRARTWHSLLGVGQSDEEQGGWSFLYNEKNPWPFRVIIGDESSMLDTALMRSVFAARPRGCHVLLVGDVHQLPPVGTGAPLRDMINSQCIGYGELTEIKRNSGGIVEACAAIRDGKPWGPGDNLIIDEATTPAKQIERMLHHINEAEANGLDPVWDTQVIVAVNDRSPLGRKPINQILQAELNSNPEIKGSPFRLGDKIVCTKNGKYTAIDRDEEANRDDDDNQVYVANGELGKVIAIEPKSFVVSLTSPQRVIRVPRGKPSAGDSDEAASGCSWELAYGMTCHKLQGSEVAICIVLVDEYPGARMVCSREWLYTGLSRAKVRCISLGKKSTADAMCRRVAIGKRKTFLRELLQLNSTEDLLKEFA